MIKLCRVDHRLVHGQVAFSWSKFLSVNCILIASDAIVNDELKQNMMRMAKPEGVKLVMKSIEDSAIALNSGVTDKYNLLILCESVEDAYKLINKTEHIKSLNLGGMKQIEDRVTISKAVSVSQQDIANLNELCDKGIEVYAQLVPDSTKSNYKSLVEARC